MKVRTRFKGVSEELEVNRPRSVPACLVSLLSYPFYNPSSCLWLPIFPLPPNVAILEILETWWLPEILEFVWRISHLVLLVSSILQTWLLVLVEFKINHQRSTFIWIYVEVVILRLLHVFALMSFVRFWVQ